MSGWDVASIIISLCTITIVIVQLWLPGFPFSLERKRKRQ